MKATKYNLPQVAKLLGVDRDKIRHASAYKQVVKAQRIGCSLALHQATGGDPTGILRPVRTREAAL